jgi:hypothetical protein
MNDGTGMFTGTFGWVLLLKHRIVHTTTAATAAALLHCQELAYSDSLKSDQGRRIP